MDGCCDPPDRRHPPPYSGATISEGTAAKRYSANKFTYIPASPLRQGGSTRQWENASTELFQGFESANTRWQEVPSGRACP